VDGSGLRWDHLAGRIKKNQWRPLTHSSENTYNSPNGISIGRSGIISSNEGFKNVGQHPHRPVPFCDIGTDPRNLTSFQNPQNINDTSWLGHENARLYFTYIIGREEEFQSDLLSREKERREKKDNQDLVLLPNRTVHDIASEENEEGGLCLLKWKSENSYRLNTIPRWRDIQ